MKICIYLIVTFSFTIGFSQNIIVNENVTPQQLVENILINSGCVTVSNITANGGNFGTNQQSFGYFNANGSIFPIPEGILLTTGKLNNSIGPNSNFSDDGSAIGWNGDSDLNAALGLSNTFNATVLEFDFISNADAISFEYLFASEQYLQNPNANQCSFTDGFAFLLKEATTNIYQNLALIPNTNIPVKVNTVRGNGTICPPANASYFDAFNTGNYPTVFDGQTKTLTAKATVIPGTKYHIKLVIADEGNARFDSGIFLKAGSFTATKNLGPNRLIATGNPLCFNETLALNTLHPGATNYQWFHNGNPVGTNNPNFTVTTAGIYSVSITLNSNCTLTGQIEIEYAPSLSITGYTYATCDTNSDGLATFNLTPIKTQISNNLPSNFTVELFSSTTATTPLPASFTNTIPFQQIIYARVTNIENCYGNIPITLNVTIFSETFNEVSIAICNNETTQISAPSGYSNYLWNTNPLQNTPSINVTTAGTYTVTITNTNGCTKTQTFIVQTSEPATITGIDVTDFEEQFTATIIVTGNGNYEYSLDGNQFQASPVFHLLDSGEYTIYVNDKNNCGWVRETFFALSYPKYFTPNADSYNDTWQIKNLNKKGFENSKITIFDRFGKVIKQLNANETGWNGTYNGHQLAASDYWFVLELANGKTIKGHFSLKR